MQGAGCSVQGVGCQIEEKGVGCTVALRGASSFGFGILRVCGVGIQASGFRVQGSGFGD